MGIVFTVNAGSSSIRLDAFETAGRSPRRLQEYHGYLAPTRAELERIWEGWGLGRPEAAAHRVVHGGTRLRPGPVDAAVERDIERAAPLAPLHNPVALEWIRAARDVLGPAVPQIAVFDTSFYECLPDVAATYAIPRALAERHAIRRYGFHGIAHASMWRSWIRASGRDERSARAVSFQLGAGCSATAVRGGRPVDTSMGFSPLEGLVMATRSGDLDPGLLLHLQRLEGMSADTLERVLNEESGLLGVSGESADMRDLLSSREPAARLAVALYGYRARKYLGSYLAALGGADGVLFGGGVGEHAPAVRETILSGLTWAGIELDAARNAAATEGEARLDNGRGPVEIWVMPADEAVLLAEEAIRTLEGSGRTSG